MDGRKPVFAFGQDQAGPPCVICGLAVRQARKLCHVHEPFRRIPGRAGIRPETVAQQLCGADRPGCQQQFLFGLQDMGSRVVAGIGVFEHDPAGAVEELGPGIGEPALSSSDVAEHAKGQGVSDQSL